MIARALIALLQGYKRYISPHLGHHCRFVPTCSEYAMQALATHGLLKGFSAASRLPGSAMTRSPRRGGGSARTVS